MNRRSFLPTTARLVLVLIAVFCLPGVVSSHTTKDKNQCRQSLTQVKNPGAKPIVVTIKELRKHPENYYGKVVTIEGEMEKEFSKRSFVAEENDGERKVLVVSYEPWSAVVVPVKHSKDKDDDDIRVTGVVQPFDLGKLECAYGPLNIKEHHFKKRGVVIVDRMPKEVPKAAQIQKPMPMPEPQPVVPEPEVVTPEPVAPEPEAVAPEPEPVPEPEVAIIQEEVVTPAKALPKTAGYTPLLALTGLFALGAAFVRRYA